MLLVAVPAAGEPRSSDGFTAGFRLGAYDPYGTFARDPRIGIEHVYIPWQDANLASLKAADQYARDRGRSLLITVEPWSWSLDSKPVEPAALHAGIVAGAYDQTIRDLCATVASIQSPTMLRWGHEMDLGNKRYPWSQWEPEQYISAYHHFADVCRSAAPGVKLMWSPRGEPNLRDYYPGDSYVDSIGLTMFGYQKYEMELYGKGLTLAERLAPAYQLVAEYNKDIYISEFGCHGDPTFVRRCMDEARSTTGELPKLAGVIYFNEVETYPWPGSFGSPDWRILSTMFAKAR